MCCIFVVLSALFASIIMHACTTLRFWDAESGSTARQAFGRSCHRYDRAGLQALHGIQASASGQQSYVPQPWLLAVKPDAEHHALLAPFPGLPGVVHASHAGCPQAHRLSSTS